MWSETLTVDEQRRIVAEVEWRLLVVWEARLARAGRLRQAILRSAFETTGYASLISVF